MKFPRAAHLVILCTGKVEQPLGILREGLDLLELRLNEAKTRIVDARQESFDFLGFSFRVRRAEKVVSSARMWNRPKNR